MGSGEPCLEDLDTGDLFLHGAGVFQHQAAGVGDALQGGERTAHVDAAVAEDDGLGEGAAGQGERLWGGRGQEGEVLQMDVGDAILYGFGEGFRVLAREAHIAADGQRALLLPTSSTTPAGRSSAFRNARKGWIPLNT